MDSATKSSQVEFNGSILSYSILPYPILSHLSLSYHVLLHPNLFYLSLSYSTLPCSTLRAVTVTQLNKCHLLLYLTTLPHYSTSLLPPMTAPVYVSFYHTVLVSHSVPAQHHYHDHYYSHCYCMLHCMPYCLCVCVCVGSGELAHVSTVCGCLSL